MVWCPEQRMKLSWFSSDGEGPETPLHWSGIALTTATLFLSFPAWEQFGAGFSTPVSLLHYCCVLPIAALLITALFFAAPAFASSAAKRPLFGIVEMSLGSIPAWGIRLCSACFLVAWIAELCSWPLSNLDRHVRISQPEWVAITVALVGFLFLTGLQGYQTNVRLAFFTDKLGVAILVAALIRVHRGLPAAFENIFDSTRNVAVPDAWIGLSWLAFSVGPIVFLASGLCHHLHEPKQVTLTAGMGIAVPLFGTLLVADVIARATFASEYYQPSLIPTVWMAVRSDVSRVAIPGLVLIGAISIFGAGRLGVRLLQISTPTLGMSRRRLYGVSVCLAGATAWCVLYASELRVLLPLEISAACLLATSGVIAGDFLSGRRWTCHTRRIDWVGVGALAAGLTVAACMNRWTTSDPISDPLSPWWHPELLPSYGTAFVACFAGRSIQRRYGRDFSSA